MNAFDEAIKALEEKRASLKLVEENALSKLEGLTRDHGKALENYRKSAERLTSVEMALAVLKGQHP